MSTCISRLYKEDGGSVSRVLDLGLIMLLVLDLPEAMGNVLEHTLYPQLSTGSTQEDRKTS